MKSRRNNLSSALKNIFDELSEPLWEKIVNLLNYYLQNGFISYEIIKKLIINNPKDPLLFLWEKKIFIPQQSSHGTLEWGDSSLRLKSKETYRMPWITERLLHSVQETKVWNVDEVIRKMFKQIGDPNYHKMSRLVRKIYYSSNHQLIEGTKLRNICEKMGIENRIDSIISELKGTGIMSPTISCSLFNSLKSRSPKYELNPLLSKIYEM